MSSHGSKPMGAVTRPKQIGCCDTPCFTTREKRVLASVRASVGRPRSRKERLEAIPIRGQHRRQLVQRRLGSKGRTHRKEEEQTLTLAGLLMEGVSPALPGGLLAVRRFFSMYPTKSLLTCPGSSICAAAICRVRDSRNTYDRRRAIEGHNGSPPCCAPALVAHFRRTIPKRGPAYLKPSRAALQMHTPLPDS